MQLTKRWVSPIVYLLIAVSVLWKGGKSLETTWILSGAVFGLTIMYYGSASLQQQKVPTHLWLLVISFVLLTFLSFVYSSTQNYGFDELLRTGACGLLFFWAYRFGGQKPHQGLIRCIAITTLIACGIGLVVYALQPVNRFVGTFFDARFHTDYWPNAWANYILLAWPFVFYWAFSQYKATSKSLEALLRCMAVGIVAGSLFLSYSRGASIALGGQIVLMILLYGPKKISQQTVRIGLCIGLIGLLYFAMGNRLRANVYDVLSVNEKVTFSADEGASSVSERRDFWHQAITLAHQKPLLGWGPYSFRFMQPRLQRAVLATSDHPHNLFLKIAVERGWIAALVLVSLIGSVLLYGFRTEIQKYDLYGHMLIVALAGSLAHNLIDYNMQFVGIGHLFWLLLGLAASRISWKKSIPILPARMRFVEMGLAVVFLTLAIVEGGYLVVSSVGRHAQAAGNTDKALLWYGRASGELFARDLHLSRAQLLQEEGRQDEAMEAVDTYFERNGEDARAWKRRGDIHRALDDTDAALQDFEYAARLGRYNDIGITRSIIDTTLEVGGRTAVAEKRTATDILLRDFAKAIVRNTHFIALSPNVEEFIGLSETFSRLYRRDAPRYEVMAAKVDHNAKRERKKIRSRAPGFLW